MAGFVHAAALTFDKQSLVIDAPADATSIAAEFNFENKSDQPVTIAKVDKTCSCIGVEVSDGKLAYAAGEKGRIRATFDVGNYTGVVNKTVVLYMANDPPDQPSVTLSVEVHIPVLVVLKEKTLKWSVGAKPATQVIDITMDYAKPIQIISNTCSSDNFKVEVKTLEAGKHYELRVTPTETKEPGLAIIRIETDCVVKRHQVLQAFAVIRRDLPSSP